MGTGAPRAGAVAGFGWEGCTVWSVSPAGTTIMARMAMTSRKLWRGPGSEGWDGSRMGLLRCAGEVGLERLDESWDGGFGGFDGGFVTEVAKGFAGNRADGGGSESGR